MEQLRDIKWTLRFNNDEWEMLDELTQKFKMKKSELVRTLIREQWKRK